MTNAEIVQKNYKLITDCVSYQFAKKKDVLYYEYINDFTQDLMLTLLEYDNEKLNKIYSDDKHLNAFITSIIKHQIYSTSSPFYVKYIKNNAKKYNFENNNDIYDEEEFEE